ncbi:MAG: ABC transporter ATP-binding protein [Bacteroidetes bacterium]|nr:MAG: ABC transporter ATP-binding protein [Bacteroidota bacterium]MBL1145889.1 ABC transporter ATP-binding protein [Bacteroidota bacterium]NOG58683.1 ABC-F family ATP-binding cassette domain-containing protein [Bacteroidota bacterium]
MNLLSVENISKRYGERVLFTDVTFGIDQGNKVALVAKNGEGKTTLLDIVSGKANSDTGSVVWRNDTRVAYLQQNEDFSAYKTIHKLFHNANNKYVKAIKLYEAAMENPHDKDGIETAMEAMQQNDAWDYDAKVEQLLDVFKLAHLEKSHEIENLSGGQKKRMSIIKMILEEPDVFILDEPTNHLDISMIEWLEDYFSEETVSLFMVTHDRYFLNRVCNQIIEIDQGAAYKYNGDYEYFLEKKAEREEVLASEIDKAKNLYRKEVEWIRRMPKARGTKSKARISDFTGIEKKAKQRIKTDELSLEIKSERLGGKILELHHIKKSYGDLKIINDFSYVFKKGEKVGIAGKNGVGKTTFLNLIMGLEQPDAGKIITGETVQFGYYSQTGIQLSEDKRIIDVVKDIAEIIPLAKGRKITASQLLERFMFPPKQQYSYVSKLSGGERKRLYLLTILMGNPNFLILDEPTNDLDIKTIAVLEDFLSEFTGCLLIVTHDRAFMDHLADHIFHFKGDGVIKDFNDTFSQLIEEEKQEELAAKKAIQKKTEKPAEVKQQVEQAKLTFEERKEYNKLEKEIEKLEAQKEEINAKLYAGGLEAEELTKLSQQFADTEKQIDTKTERWLLLAERA